MDKIFETIEAFIDTHPELEDLEVRMKQIATDKMVVTYSNGQKFLVTVTDLKNL